MILNAQKENKKQAHYLYKYGKVTLTHDILNYNYNKFNLKTHTRAHMIKIKKTSNHFYIKKKLYYIL